MGNFSVTQHGRRGNLCEKFPPAGALRTLEPTTPRKLTGLAPLARIAFNGGDLTPVATHDLERWKSDAADADAVMDLSTVLQLMGEQEQGLELQSIALDLRRHYRVVGATEPPALRLLSIHTPGDLTRNNTLEFLVESTDVELQLLYVTEDTPLPDPLPDHDLAIVSVCQSRRNHSLLQHLEGLMKDWPRPVLCRPRLIDRLSRDGVAGLLRDIPGTVVPATITLARQTLEQLGRSEMVISELLPDGDFPIIIRPVDSDKGFGLAKITNADEIVDYLKGRPEASFYTARFVEYRNDDGQYRKYRIVFIGGEPYVCHMAISPSWIVHYMSAGMFENPEKRAEEARFFESFEEDFALRHRHALRLIAERLALEYVGIDCGEAPDGRLLLFEADSGMTVHSMDPPELFPYKRPQMRKVFQAFREMLLHMGERRPFENAA